MENSKQLAGRFREVILNGKWIANTNMQEQVSGLTWKQATYKIGSLNTIAALTFHINYYIGGILHVFDGGGLEIRDKYAFDLTEIKSQEAWESLVQSLISNAWRFAEHIERMTDSELDEVFVDEKYGNYRRNIEGMIEHSYYHLGQIALIRKLVLESERA
jgi:uncharacterized damage-inducible protein DinB